MRSRLLRDVACPKARCEPVAVDLRVDRPPLDTPSDANLSFATRGGNSSVVEHDLAKVGVAGSNPVSRSSICAGRRYAAPGLS